MSYIAKGLLPYKGLGSGIKRALDDWPEIDFTDDREECLFTATVHRKEVLALEKSSEKILSLVKIESTLSAREIALRLGITQRAVEKQIARLRKAAGSNVSAQLKVVIGTSANHEDCVCLFPGSMGAAILLKSRSGLLC